MAAGAFLFVPAALTETYGVFLGGLFTLGAGLAVPADGRQPVRHPPGPKESAARRISLMGIGNKGAGILAPILFAAVVLRVTDTSLFAALPTMAPAAKAAALDELIRRVVVPYACLGWTLLALGFLVRLSPLPEIDTEHETPDVAEANADKTSVCQFPQLVLGALGIFLHVGTQTVAVDTIIGYAETMGIPLAAAKILPGCVLAAMILGYVLGLALIPRIVSQVTALRACTLLGVVGTLGVLGAPGRLTFLGLTADTSLWCLTLLGLSNSLTWAGIWPLALDGLGPLHQGRRLADGHGALRQRAHPARLRLARGSAWGAERLLDPACPVMSHLTYYAMSGHKKREW
jgi:fucose permease